MKNVIKINLTAALVVFLNLSSYELISQNTNYIVTHSQGDTFEMIIPIVFSNDDIGLAYTKTLTGLQGNRIIDNNTISSYKNRIRKDLYKIPDGFILNTLGTGTGMYRTKLEADTDIRRANLTISRINSITENSVAMDWRDLRETDKPLLLVKMEYGNGMNISISGEKSNFTDEVFTLLEQKFVNGIPIDDLLNKYELTATFDLRGIQPKDGGTEIPISWEDLKSKYYLDEPVPLVGRFLLLEDIKAKRIEWE